MVAQNTLIQLFQAHAATYPEDVAIDDFKSGPGSHSQVTYGKLDAASSAFARRLTSYGVCPGGIVPVTGTRSIPLVIAKLALLKLRCCYVPIDTESWSRDRAETVLSKVDSNYVVSTEMDFKLSAERKVIHFGPWNEEREALLKCAEGDTLSNRNDSPVQDSDSEQNLVYIIFTSGTTGTAKGVPIPEKSLAAYVQSNMFNMNVQRESRVLLICSIAFDACAAILFSTLCNGGTLVLATPDNLIQTLATCTTAVMTPSILSSLEPSAKFDTLRDIFLGGEAPTPALVQSWSRPNRRLYNGYGPTEATCGCLMGELVPGRPISFGTPISFSKILLIDDDGHEADEGEIYIGGLGLTPGYYKEPALNSQSFVTREDTRYFKSKDWAVRTPHGYVLKGRKDTFVKNRGFLINLEGDVESALMSESSAQAAVAAMHDNQLFGFVSPSACAVGLRNRMLEKYSGFMVPDRIFGLDGFPRTANGKADRRQLISNMEAGFANDFEDYDPNGVESSIVIRAVAGVLHLPLKEVKQDASFLELGGHSLAALKLSRVLSNQGAHLSVAEILSINTLKELITIFDGHQQEQVPRPATLLPTAQGEFALTGDSSSNVMAPMTDLQRRMIRSSLQSPSLNYIRTTIRYSCDKVPAASLISAWRHILTRHSIFRTWFDLSTDDGQQVVQSQCVNHITTVEVPDGRWEEEMNAAEAKHIADASNLEFDERSPGSLCNVRIFTSTGKPHTLFWTVHHSLIDGASVEIVLNEIDSIISGNRTDKAPAQFYTFARYDESLHAQQESPRKEFWRSALEGRLPCRFYKPRISASEEQRSVDMCLGITVNSLQESSSRFKTTMATLLYGAWAIVLSRYCQDSVIMGIVLSGRDIPIAGVETVVGPMLNVVPLALDVEESENLGTHFGRVFRRLCETMEHGRTSNELIYDATGIKATDYYESLFSLDYGFETSDHPEATVKKFVESIEYAEQTEHPLSVVVGQDDGQVTAKFVYRAHCFEDETISDIMGALKRTLSSVCSSSSDEAVAKMSKCVLDTDTLNRLQGVDAIQPTASNQHSTLIHRFEGICKDYPNNIAIEAQGQRITYHELLKKVCTVGGQISSYVEPGDIVCILSDGTVEWVIAILSALACGAAYCPVDCSLPPERQAAIMAKAKCSLALSANAQPSDAVAAMSVHMRVADLVAHDDTQKSMTEFKSSTHDLAVVIFTSGSTGTPKGCPLRNDAIVSLLEHAPARLNAGPGRRVAQLLSLGLDCCVVEIFSALCFGGTLLLKDPEDSFSHLKIADCAIMTASLLSALHPSDYERLQTIVVGGEPVSQALVEAWAPERSLYNGYGPAECTLIATMTELRSKEPVTIGRPVPGMVAYILDSKSRPVPVGVDGEICLSGLQVINGYLDPESPEINSRFVPDPFRPNSKMYRTGDRGRWTRSYNLEYIGRQDDQIKLKGFRLDLLDIENVIAGMGLLIRKVAAVPHKGMLVIFVTPSSIDGTELKAVLKQQLPHYCPVRDVISLDELPLSANLKVDRKALAGRILQQAESLHNRELHKTEAMIAGIWRTLLELPDECSPGPDDRFSDLGGHSLHQIKLARQISQHVDYQIPLKKIIENDRLADLADVVDSLDTPAARAHSFLSFQGSWDYGAISDLECHALTGHEQAKDKATFNMGISWHLSHGTSIAKLHIAIVRLAQESHVLNTCFQKLNGRYTRRFVRSPPNILYVFEQDDLEKQVKAAMDKPFDVQKVPLWRVTIIKRRDGSGKRVFVFTMSHLIGDGATLSMLLQRLSHHYSASPLDSLAVGTCTAESPAYARWVAWQKSLPHSKDTNEFWLKCLDITPAARAPFGHFDKQRKFEGRATVRKLPDPISEHISETCKSAGASKHHALLLAVACTLSAMYRVTESMFIGIPRSNRDDAGTEGLQGLLLDKLPIRVDLPFSGHSLTEVLCIIRDNVRSALAHSLPYRNIQRMANTGTNHDVDLIHTMVTFHAAEDNLHHHLKIQGSAPMQIYPGGARFPLMAQFFETQDGSIYAHIEHDTGVFTDERAALFTSCLFMTLDLMFRMKLKLDSIGNYLPSAA